jgi:hypothetical protein
MEPAFSLTGAPIDLLRTGCPTKGHAFSHQLIHHTGSYILDPDIRLLPIGDLP